MRYGFDLVGTEIAFLQVNLPIRIRNALNILGIYMSESFNQGLHELFSLEVDNKINNI